MKKIKFKHKFIPDSDKNIRHLMKIEIVKLS